MTKSLALVGLMALTPSMASVAFAQTPLATNPDVLTTRIGNELSVSVQHYDYTEPPPVDISIHAAKFGGEYTGTFALSHRRRWFAQVNLRGTGAVASYDGNCRPWLIVPSSTSANGYRLTLGSSSPCSESGDADWSVEGRALATKDFTGRVWSISPFSGVGVRHLSNGTTGHVNYRTEEYLYVPVGAAMRTTAVAGRVLGVTVEYDRLLRGWNTTRNSLLGGGVVPATDTAPAFSIGDFTDVSFHQHTGWALRASASYSVSRAWSIEPYYLRWRVAASPVSDGSVAFAVDGVTVRQTLRYVEPLNFTNEFGVKIGFHFGGR
jgi:hypothetical protein